MRYVFFVLFVWVVSNTFAQDKNYAKKMIDTLASPSMQGRGYVNNGDRLAAEFLEVEMREIGLKPLFKENSYFQAFTHTVNVFVEEPLLQFGKQALTPGAEYIIEPFSGELIGNFSTLRIEASDIPQLQNKLNAVKPTKTAIILYAHTAEDYKKLSEISMSCLRYANALIMVNPSKLTWSVSNENVPGKAVFEVSKEAFDAITNQKKVKLACQPVLHKNYESRNVAGFVEGEVKDTFLLLTAHYDHLGKLGTAIFPGANDNASGTAMMLNLARFYEGNTKRPHYSIAFVAFAGEEAGLVGSKYFVENLPVSKKKIRFVFNIDLMGGGTTGATVVNGSVYENEFAIMERINTEHNLLNKLKKRGKAANSDHYWFSEKGIPAFFMYAEGGVTQYHDVNDTREKLPLDEYDDLFRLIHLFVDSF